MAEEQEAAAQQERPQQQFAMQRIYNKDLSFESPSTPMIFKKQWQPQVNVDLNTKSDTIDEQGNFEVVLTVTITAKIEDDTAFLIEVQQAGIFFISGFEGEDLRRILGTAAPNVLFPYARESIDSLCVKGGFPPVMLAPVNFEAMYQQAMAQQAQAAPEGGEAATH
ncbi:MAG: protein-export chaperone SecB [Gammaproteobacteria bacterium]|nr:MAG: protein-export chaperone SecB [Gammaproteobacteria bacterium]RLA59732.1 MAG: protein-export chaperone SecB [Gammaproteobacteria bacterium]